MELTLVRKYIERDAQEAARRRRMLKYFRAQNDIKKRELSDPSKPNNRVAHAYARLIATSYAGYLFGRPVTYSSKNEVLKSYVDATFKYNDEQAENSELGLDLAIYGVAVELLYIDEDSFVRFKRVDPIGCIAVKDDSVEENLTHLIRYYDVEDVATGNKERRVEVLDAELWCVYRDFGGAFTLIECREHGFRDVPAVVYRNNSDQMGDFEPVVDLIDAYDLMQSESLNDQEYFTDAYLKLKGIGEMPDDQLAKMKRNRVLLLPDDTDADFLIKPHDGSVEESIKDRINNDIHRFSGCPDMGDENFSGNTSGVAMKYKLLQFENIAGVKEREFKRGLQRRFELLCNVWDTLGRGWFDWRDVEISFHRTLPENVLEISQTLSNIGSLLSNETKRSMLPMSIDEDSEKARLAEEQQAGLSLYTIQERLTGDVFGNAE